MLTFRKGTIDGPAAALRMARHLACPTLAPDMARSHAKAARQPDEGGRTTVPHWRDDLDPRYPSLLGLDLSRPLSLNEIAGLLRGRRADGGIIPGKPKSQIGYIDLTFSAEKDVSIIWALGTAAERGIVWAVHRAAVQTTMEIVEQAIGRARLGRGGRDGSEPGSIAWLGFEQATARAPDQDRSSRGDPNLHLHVIVLNVVLTQAGRVRALDLQGLQHRIHELGATARALTAQGLRGHGVSIMADPDTGMFRVSLVPDALRQAFSQRTVTGLRAVQGYFGRTGEIWSDLTEPRRIALTKAGVQTAFPGRRQDDLADPERWRAVAAALGWSPLRFILSSGAAAAAPSRDVLASATNLMLTRLERVLRDSSVVYHHQVRTIAAQVVVATGLPDAGVDEIIADLQGRTIEQDGALRPLQLLTNEDRRGDAVVHVTSKLQPIECDQLVTSFRDLLTFNNDGDMSTVGLKGSVRISHDPASRRWLEELADARVRETDWCWIGFETVDNWGASVADPHRTVLARLFENGREIPSLVLIEDLGRVHPRDVLRLLNKLRQWSAQVRMYLRVKDPGPWAVAALDVVSAAWPGAAPPDVLDRKRDYGSDRFKRIGRDAGAVIFSARASGTARLIHEPPERFVEAVAERWMEERDRHEGVPGIIVPADELAAPIVAAVRARLRGAGALDGPDHAVETLSSRGARATVILAVGDVIILGKRVNARRVDRSRGLFAVAGSRVTITGISGDGLRALNAHGHEGLMTWEALRDVTGDYRLDQGYVFDVSDAPSPAPMRIWVAERAVVPISIAWMQSAYRQSDRSEILLLSSRAFEPELCANEEPDADRFWALLASRVDDSLATPASSALSSARAARGLAGDALRAAALRVEEQMSGSRCSKLRRLLNHQMLRRAPAEQDVDPTSPARSPEF